MRLHTSHLMACARRVIGPIVRIVRAHSCCNPAGGVRSLPTNPMASWQSTRRSPSMALRTTVPSCALIPGRYRSLRRHYGTSRRCGTWGSPARTSSKLNGVIALMPIFSCACILRLTHQSSARAAVLSLRIVTQVPCAAVHGPYTYCHRRVASVGAHRQLRCSSSASFRSVIHPHGASCALRDSF
ncbi:hypothetical protein L226DRAFT_283303 [Lentinus tigrinus ALCF2SS1-7]|uniref:uncharacterized protein n=1 Tax=Lentinus tigrinus ALCF2SS1-7 TaxID=1328758 RepID=UPI00116625CE|nr:hypothetical protein L226DRAFT_283303 [Lentinus tigrinus ALCF2SS1-7]